MSGWHRVCWIVLLGFLLAACGTTIQNDPLETDVWLTETAKYMTFTPTFTATATPSTTKMPSSTPTSTPTPSHTPTPTVTPTPSFTPFPTPETLNDVSVDEIIRLPEDVIQNAQDIYQRGLVLGNDPRAFSKLGDSVIENPHFLTRFDGDDYNLGEYGYLQEVITFFHGSFAREGVAVRRGLHAWAIFDPLWADKDLCLPNEDILRCELRLHRASVLFIRLGSNEMGDSEAFDRSMREVVELAIAQGVIPVIATKADRRDANDMNNMIMRTIATDYQIPLWDFDRVAGTLPRRGLDLDGIHLTAYFSHDYRQPEAFTRGHSVHNLTALLMLDALWRQVMLPVGVPDGDRSPTLDKDTLR